MDLQRQRVGMSESLGEHAGNEYGTFSPLLMIIREQPACKEVHNNSPTFKNHDEAAVFPLAKGIDFLHPVPRGFANHLEEFLVSGVIRFLWCRINKMELGGRRRNEMGERRIGSLLFLEVAPSRWINSVSLGQCRLI